jgi:hypothetical protein
MKAIIAVRSGSCPIGAVALPDWLEAGEDDVDELVLLAEDDARKSSQ